MFPLQATEFLQKAFFEENKEKFEFVYKNLADEESKRVFENIVNFKISGKVKYLYNSTEADKNNIYKDILKLSSKETIVDMGAYDGDTIREFTAYTSGAYKHIYALEPDEKTLKSFSATQRICKG